MVSGFSRTDQCARIRRRGIPVSRRVPQSPAITPSRRTPKMDPIRRKLLKTGAAATAMAAAQHVLAQQTRPGGAGSFYEKGPVRIHYEEAGSGFPLLLIAGGG